MNDELWEGIDYQGNFYEHNYNSDSDMDDIIPFCPSNIERAGPSLTDESEMQDAPEDLKIERFPAILRTNSQIYNEASTLLYSELNVCLEPGDILCMNNHTDIVDASEKVWRHNPLQGIETKDQGGLTVYETPELDGVMEPHVVARFKKITVDMDFHYWEVGTLEALRSRQMEGVPIPRDRIAPSLSISDNLTVNPEDEKRLLAFYRRSAIIPQLVKILANCAVIVHLDMILDLKVLAKYQDTYMDTGSEDDENTSICTDSDVKVDIVNERAIDLFLESGFLAPLEKLSNVRQFTFNFMPQY